MVDHTFTFLVLFLQNHNIWNLYPKLTNEISFNILNFTNRLPAEVTILRLPMLAKISVARFFMRHSRFRYCQLTLSFLTCFWRALEVSEVKGALVKFAHVLQRHVYRTSMSKSGRYLQWESMARKYGKFYVVCRIHLKLRFWLNKNVDTYHVSLSSK